MRGFEKVKSTLVSEAYPLRSRASISSALPTTWGAGLDGIKVSVLYRLASAIDRFSSFYEVRKELFVAL